MRIKRVGNSKRTLSKVSSSNEETRKQQKQKEKSKQKPAAKTNGKNGH